MEKTKITISLTEYAELVKSTERIAAVERFLNSNKYVTASDVASLLGIERKAEVNDVLV